MAKPFKIFLWILGTFVVLMGGAIAAVAVLFDPNDYKGQVVTAVKKETGRDLVLGDIGLTFYPVLGASVEGVTLSNAQGFGDTPFLQIGELKVGVKLMPLLKDRAVQVSTVYVQGLALNLAKDAQGRTNWGDLSKLGGGAKDEKPTEPTGDTGGPALAVSVDKVDIKDASFAYTDALSGAAYKVDKLAIETGAVNLGQPLDVTISFLVNSTQPPLESEVKLAFTAVTDLDKKVYELKNVALDTVTRGQAVPGGEQKASLRAQAKYDGAAGAFELTDTTLKAAGLELTAAVKGENLSGEAPKLSGTLGTNTFNARELAQAFGAPLPPAADMSTLTKVGLKSAIAGDPKNVRLDPIQIALDQTTMNGWLSVKDFAAPVIGFALRADKLDADRYLAPATDKKEEKPAEDKGGDFKQIEIPVQALDAVNASGTLALDQLTLKGLQMTSIKIVLDAPKGKVKTQELTASLYGGKIAQSAKITPGPSPKYDVKIGLNGVNSAPLQQDLIGKNWLSGLGNFNLNFTGAGLTVGEVLKGLGGSLATSFQNGAVEGFNLEQTITQAKATFRGEAAPAESGPKRTEFKDLKAAGTITNGVLDTSTLDVKSGSFQLGGDGKVDLFNQTLDYELLPTLTGEKFKDIAGAKIPVKITGSWYAPKVKVDLAGTAKSMVKEEIKKQETKLKEKASQKLGDFLNRKLAPKEKPAPAPAPAEPAPAPAEPAPAPAEPAPSEPAPAPAP